MHLTEDGKADIEAAATRLRSLAPAGENVLFLATRTNRSRQTAEALRAAIDPGAPSVEPAWGLRNPDLYLAGERVEMMSSADAIAAQFTSRPMTPEAVLAHPFFNGFLSAPDRIGYWLTHKAPPGETAAAVARRVLQFAQSFTHSVEGDMVVACVSHSPVLRALIVEGLGLRDPGEPGWVEAVNLHVSPTEMTYQFRDQEGRVRSL
jgi:broad specificity phosphatase PhoE